ncbi:4Fe-4S ferredoxin-type, iron-sulphur binding domain protein [Acididesulfobacillus acetoxydans]|uniref:4Fe-4S ferredoxin-type, iron-sulphur binding domain protein n=1 Tax=Acididesulfobacillus acetoxydans TaxID=1561005 RepID=A0A8S0W6G6_9FIRM|nr:(Fe-S)-binding protein [Acididesulfobacillus acetoxydans]CAA7599829.1 4Fe-4S ferredoxin-type, iron-sulphur binding domain protein [Acididesulfobacillus acetoxydans]CEJ07395.1 CoB--CoM heterodisulfide reductase iron-sulfur subunit D [Acididesulfobacillus acetoxydans]
MDEIKNVSLEMKDYIASSGAETLSWCMQCGLCTNLCPWRLVPGEVSENFNIRKMQRLGQLGLEGFEEENILFACVTCGMCQINCPRNVEIIDNVRSMRNTTVGAGFLPAHLRPIAGSLHANGNPWSGEREKRAAWQNGLDIPAFTEDTEYLLFVCCTSCYDTRSQKIAKSIVRLLKAAGVNFGVLTAEENCCGESIRKLGDEELFQKLAQGNIDLFKRNGVKKIITTSPHCLYAFKKDYPELGGEFEVMHYSEVLAQLVKEGKLAFPEELVRKVTFHDPCYLGRHNQVFDPPRELIQAIPGVEFVELDRSRNKSLCCAGGGGRIWAEVPMGERFGELRITGAVEKQADTLVTACPYCIIMLDDACAGLEKGDVLQVMEMSELLCKALDPK